MTASGAPGVRSHSHNGQSRVAWKSEGVALRRDIKMRRTDSPPRVKTTDVYRGRFSFGASGVLGGGRIFMPGSSYGMPNIHVAAVTH